MLVKRDSNSQIRKNHKKPYSAIQQTLCPQICYRGEGLGLYQQVSTFIPAWISNCIHCKAWDEITGPFPNFNDEAVEVWEWIGNFILNLTRHMITYPCWDERWSMLVKGAPRMSSSQLQWRHISAWWSKIACNSTVCSTAYPDQQQMNTLMFRITNPLWGESSGDR